LLKSDEHIDYAVLADYAHKLADYYNGIIGSFRPELNETSTDVLNSIFYDMVMHNALR